MKGEDNCGEISDADSVKEIESGSSVTLEDLKTKMAEFARERNWDQFHSPRNLLLALVGEVGELSEIFQWKGEVPKGLPDWNAAEKEHLGEELSDVLLYLVRLADICGVDLGEAALRKVKKNGLKYPIERCKGSSKKYTHYNNVVNVEDLRVDKL
eukprot:Gb_07518 [translate_table: standard]